jgi:hypothetical protein
VLKSLVHATYNLQSFECRFVSSSVALGGIEYSSIKLWIWTLSFTFLSVGFMFGSENKSSLIFVNVSIASITDIPNTTRRIEINLERNISDGYVGLVWWRTQRYQIQRSRRIFRLAADTFLHHGHEYRHCTGE